MNKEDRIEFVAKYLMGSLSLEENRKFELEIESDIELREEYIFQSLLRDSLPNYNFQERRHELVELFNQQEEKISSVRSNDGIKIRKIIFALVAACLLCAVATFLFFNLKSSDRSALAVNYTLESLDNTTRGNSLTNIYADSLRTILVESIRLKNYNMAIELGLNGLNDPTYNDLYGEDTRFEICLALILENRPSEAIERASKFRNQRNGCLYDWIQALALVKDNRTEEAKRILEQGSICYPYDESAEQLLDDLD